MPSSPTIPGVRMVPEVTQTSEGMIAIDWTGHKRAGSPIGPFLTLTREQWLGLVTQVKRLT
jgi:hypothetical protein